MRFSKLKAHGLDIYTQYIHPYGNKVGEFGYDYFKPQKTHVSYPIAALNPSYELLYSDKHSNNFSPMSSKHKYKSYMINWGCLRIYCENYIFSAAPLSVNFFINSVSQTS